MTWEVRLDSGLGESWDEIEAPSHFGAAEVAEEYVSGFSDDQEEFLRNPPIVSVRKRVGDRVWRFQVGVEIEYSYTAFRVD